ncbi:hypothetical protein N658DRAFT_520225 [Parathielavia hyrcaniae]|uniref:BRCT domain-containing protein n=1 Tax=Parathielavia hyrcaniae TaxID=113614 RepID=A0AAN6QAS2_9PEZI|nr:hypothetical protein N658DRAFT_520225 [Parathielavia hyrcaniae]
MVTHREPKLTRKETSLFLGLTIARAGDLKAKKGRRQQWSDANVAQWVALRGGKYVGEKLDGGGDVTHLVCSRGEFRRRGGFNHGHDPATPKLSKTCQIVSPDWLEDSMLKKKRQPEHDFSHVEQLKRERNREQKALMAIKGLEKAEKEVDPNFYHLHRDHTFFQYEVALTRRVWVAKEGVFQEERHLLSLYESNTGKPHLYWFVAKFYKKKGDSPSGFHRPSHAPGVFAREFAHFEYFFQEKAGIPWAERLVKAGTAGKDRFQYQPPTGGKPVGWAPAQYIPAEIPVIGTADVATDDTPDSDTPPPAATDTDGNNGQDTLSKIAAVAAEMSDAPGQTDQLMTPAPSPRADLSIRVTSFMPQKNEDEKQIGPATPSVDTPAASWPTFGTTPCTMMELTA